MHDRDWAYGPTDSIPGSFSSSPCFCQPVDSTVAYKVSGYTETLGSSAFATFVKAHYKVVHLCTPTCRLLPVKNC